MAKIPPTRGTAPRTMMLSIAIVATILMAALAPALPALAAPAGAAAPGGPGALSHFDLARKDCLGAARNTTSRVWYTVAGGVLSDVYYPTLDNTNNETCSTS